MLFAMRLCFWTLVLSASGSSAVEVATHNARLMRSGRTQDKAAVVIDENGDISAGGSEAERRTTPVLKVAGKMATSSGT